jgi:CCR4-NOT transcriptional regulation complex NOT5 subunit
MQAIQNNEVYKQILKDSFGGIMYNVANRNKYDTAELLKLWDSLSAGEQSASGGIMSGAINFIKGN